MSIKKPAAAPANMDGSGLRIAIVHARWNPSIIEPLVSGAQKTLLANGVKASNIHVSSCPGSFELPFAAQRLISASQAQQASSASAVTATDLLSATGDVPSSGSTSDAPLKTQFDAVIAIGVLIKGETMHFEYICDAVSHGLMKLQLDARIPVIFGVLTCLTDEQAQARAGIGGSKHNHGESWGEAAVEMALKNAAAL
ncbi:lumazine synthase [Savitreella phatthalungensis]